MTTLHLLRQTPPDPFGYAPPAPMPVGLLADALRVRTPIGPLIDAWEAAQAARGILKAAERAHCVRAICQCGGIESMQQFTPGNVTSAIAARRAQGNQRASTINVFWLSCLRGFSQWLELTGRTGDRMRSLAEFPKDGRRLKRRVLTEAEAQALIAAARQSTIRRNRLTGEQRAILYHLALSTGMRAKELRLLRHEHFQLDRRRIVLPGDCTKNREEAVLFLPTELCQKMATWLAIVPPGQPVFPMGRLQARAIQDDCRDAAIPIETRDGKIIFHKATRGTFVTDMGRTGADTSLARKLARHSSESLTVNVYTQVADEDAMRAIERLPKRE